MTTFLFAIEDFFLWSFGFLKILGNFPNIALSVIAFLFLCFWLYQTALFEKNEK